MKGRENLVGKRFGRLTVLRLSETRQYRDKLSWECVCDCGGTKLVATSNFRCTKSCGCLKKEMAGINFRKEKTSG